MKKLITTDIALPNSNMPIKKGGLDHLQNAYTEMCIAIASQLIGKPFATIGQSAILGCLNVGSYPVFDISAGWILYNGTLYEVDAVTFNAGAGTAVASIVTTYVTSAIADPVEFTDGNFHNVHQIKKIAFSAGVSGSGLFDYNDLIICTIPAGTEVTYDTGWDNGGSGGVKYRKNRDGLVTLEGRAFCNGTPADTDQIFVLPAGFRPPVELWLPAIFNDQVILKSAQVNIKTTGRVYIFDSVSGGSTYNNDDSAYFSLSFYNH